MTTASACVVRSKKKWMKEQKKKKYANATTSCDSKKHIHKKQKHFSILRI
jgi:hypothetical protein